MNNQIPFKIGENMVNAVTSKIALRPNPIRPTRVNVLPEVLFITSYPPRECGIATYSQDLIKTLNDKFGNSFSIKVCALEAGKPNRNYPADVKYTLDTLDSSEYHELAHTINMDDNIDIILIQHEFGLFGDHGEMDFLQLIYTVAKPIVLVFHTVLPRPNPGLRIKVKQIAVACASIIVMTKNAAQILMNDYGVSEKKILVIPHGTHLVPHLDKEPLKEKYGLKGKQVLATFGLLGSGKSIETTLEALPAIVKINPDVVFMVIGKTHSGVIKSEGEKYRKMLSEKVAELKLEHHVRFINRFLPLNVLLELLQLTDIYLFTSKDPNQAVSGTFSYAMSCGCPIISTPIPHAQEVLAKGGGILIDFQNPGQLSEAVNRLMGNEALRKDLGSNALHRIVPTAWENSAIAHANLLQKIVGQNNLMDDSARYFMPMFNQHIHRMNKIPLQYSIPSINLEHVKKMTTDFGIIQFSKINEPDLESGYTLDDNARALIAMCMHHQLTGGKQDIALIRVYLNFIKHCQMQEGDFLNYVDSDRQFTDQNTETNLSDANGRAIWALGYLISKKHILPEEIILIAEDVLMRSLGQAERMCSPRAMAFTIKGLYYANTEKKSPVIPILIRTLADRLVQMYRHESDQNWKWFESYLTYANSVLPEAMLCAWLETGDTVYKEIAKNSFEFLLSFTFNENGIKVISNKTWLKKGQKSAQHGEQPIDVAYTILALSRFYKVFRYPSYFSITSIAFDWFLGKNHLHQIIYNPCTGGCYDGLEEDHVNLNQGAESTLSYLMARLTMEKHTN